MAIEFMPTLFLFYDNTGFYVALHPMPTLFLSLATWLVRVAVNRMTTSVYNGNTSSVLPYNIWQHLFYNIATTFRITFYVFANIFLVYGEIFI